MERYTELDKLVAEEVMGWHQEREDDWLWMNSNGKIADLAGVDGWSPSTDIKDAWLVVEKLQELPPIWDCDSYIWFFIDAPNGVDGHTWWAGWKCYVDYEGDSIMWSAEGDTVMEAICKAALERVNDI